METFSFPLHHSFKLGLPLFLICYYVSLISFAISCYFNILLRLCLLPFWLFCWLSFFTRRLANIRILHPYGSDGINTNLTNNILFLSLSSLFLIFINEKIFLAVLIKVLLALLGIYLLHVVQTGQLTQNVPDKYKPVAALF